MIKDRKQVNATITDTLKKNYMQDKVNSTIKDFLYAKHNVDPAFSLGILTGKINVDSIRDEQLFWLCECMEEAYKTKRLTMPVMIEDIFTASEISYYKHTKEEKTSKKPIRFKCMAVSDDQWVTVMSSKDIMRLYNEQLIRYNPLTQREPTVKTKDGIVKYVITIVKSSVKAISALMQKSLYIPDDLSLNINPESDTEWDIVGDEIVLINGAFDIIDGFHRLMAISSCSKENPDFSYNMVVNIMNFDTEKACRYIAQKDKRNKINKAYSNSLDTSKEVNTVLTRLNERTAYYKGAIGRTEDALINWTSFYNLVDYCFTIKTRREALEVQNYLKNCLDTFIDENPEYIDKKLSTWELAVITRCASHYYKTTDYESAMEQAVQIMSNTKDNKFHLSRLNEKKFNEIDRRLPNV